MSLKDEIRQRIQNAGPLSMADYMAECLLHPRFGYYTTRDPFGSAGDFITAPDISQMFGELVGLALAQAWMDQGQPAPFTLAELGPGRGTLMADVLRATAGVSGFHAAAQISLVEASPRLQSQQRDTLAPFYIHFAPHADALPDQALFCVANEFFDALPVRQFVRTENGWRERQVGLDGMALAFGLGPETDQPALAHRVRDTKAGDTVETAPQAAPICEALSARIARHGGAALIIDYGDWRSLGDTVQAMRGHAYSDVLDDPGAADITAHVDFEALAQAASHCAHSKLTPQGVFLERLGITARAQALAARLSEPALGEHISAHRRLTHPEEMGNLFKVLGLFPVGMPPPPGLEI